MAARGDDWKQWVDELPRVIADLVGQWKLRPDGGISHGSTSAVQCVRLLDSTPAVLKVSFPAAANEHSHLALRRWNGNGAVRLLSADPPRRALLLERLRPVTLDTVPDVDACAVVAQLYRRLHVPPMPQLPSLPVVLEQWASELEALPRSAPTPHRLVEQAVALCRELAAEPASAVVHGNLHYGNVHVSERDSWLAISPKPINGDPHYELAPMLWHRFDELAGSIREGVRHRFYTLVERAELDEQRARAWVIVRATRASTANPADATRFVTLAKAVQN